MATIDRLVSRLLGRDHKAAKLTDLVDPTAGIVRKVARKLLDLLVLWGTDSHPMTLLAYLDAGLEWR